MTRTASRLDSLVVIGMLALIVFTALFHGAVEPWSRALYELSVIVLVLFWMIKSVLAKEVRVFIPRIAFPVIGFLLYGLIQSISFTNSTGSAMGLSVDTEATRYCVFLLFIHVTALLIISNFFNNQKRLSLIAKFLVFYGMCIAIFAITQHFTWNGRYFWLRPTGTNTDTGVLGMFVNHNHFAGYMELLVPIPIGLIIAGAASKAKLLYAFAAVIMAVTIIASLSRGGMISLFVELATLAVLGARYHRANVSEVKIGVRSKQAATAIFANFLSKYGVMAVIVVAIVIGTLWIGATPVLNRVTDNQVRGKSESFNTSRGWIWHDTWSLIKDNPVFGIGLGAFGTAFPIYSRDNGMTEFGVNYTVDRAHNDYLQVQADCGIVGTILLLWFLFELGKVAISAAKTRDPLLAGLALGSTSACVAMMVHSGFDFNLQLPSHSLLLLTLVGVIACIGASVNRTRESTIAEVARVAA